jgi:hypothetical protein
MIDDEIDDNVLTAMLAEEDEEVDKENNGQHLTKVSAPVGGTNAKVAATTVV